MTFYDMIQQQRVALQMIVLSFRVSPPIFDLLLPLKAPFLLTHPPYVCLHHGISHPFCTPMGSIAM